ncbi:MAG TPA: hemolysin family protein [Acidimicrobiia bacterium]|nr:hemolysin family protein [Acidimicrobiia bacterium]
MGAVVLLILLNAFFVAGEFAIVAVDRSLVERKARDGERGARRILHSLRNLSFELSGAQLGITVTSLVLGAIAEPAVASLIEPVLLAIPFIPEETSLAISVLLTLVLATGFQMVFGELVPKNLAIARPYRSAVWFGIPMQVVNRLLRQLILLLNNSANWTVRRLGIEPREELAGVRSMEELELMIRSSGEEGRLDDEEMELLTRAITFTEKVAADAMVPRVSVVGLSRHDSIAELRRTSAATGHSRFPVFDEGLDDIVGIVHVKDSITVPASRIPVTPVGEITQAALQVPESSTLENLLSELQKAGRGMAIVVDEYGGTAGVVTIEDLLEEIFGDIEDEYDREPEPDAGAEEIEVLSGLLHRHEVEEAVGFEWPDGRYETLGGFLVSRLGRFPRAGEVIRVGDTSFEILAMDGHRVDQVRVIRLTDLDEGTR